MERLSYQDIRAFETLYDRYGNLVYSTALRVLRDPHLAEEVAQDIFLRLWQRPEAYVAHRGRFAPWLLSVTRNRAVDEVRSRSRRYRHEAAPGDQERELPGENFPDPALTAQLQDERRAVRQALAELPGEQRRVIELAYFGGFTQQEIAEMLGQPLGTVKTRIRLGMQKLKGALLRREQQPERP